MAVCTPAHIKASVLRRDHVLRQFSPHQSVIIFTCAGGKLWYFENVSFSELLQFVPNMCHNTHKFFQVSTIYA